MNANHPPYTRRKFSLWWRGRRWYDPNERKVIGSTLCLTVLAMVTRVLLLGFSSTHPQLLSASPSPVHGIIGTAHDLSATGLHHVTQAAEVCVFCHAPHDGQEGISQNIPEWNHLTTTVQFVVNGGSGIKGTLDSQPTGPSLACLSCHDGTVAMGALHEVPNGGGESDYSHAEGGVSRTTGLMQGANLVGRDLSRVHPISMTYRDDLNKGLRHPSELVGVRLYPSNIRGGKVQCASCHDPHNFGAEGRTAPFLRVTKQGSLLCLSCHLV